jgi:hypothetical protein
MSPLEIENLILPISIDKYKMSSKQIETAELIYNRQFHGYFVLLGIARPNIYHRVCTNGSYFYKAHIFT